MLCFLALNQLCWIKLSFDKSLNALNSSTARFIWNIRVFKKKYFLIAFCCSKQIKQEKWDHLLFYAYLHESNEKRKYQHFRKKIELTCLLGQVTVVCSRLHFFYSPLSLNTRQYTGICRCLDIKFTVEVFKRLFVPFVVSEDRQNRTGSALIF